MHLATRSTCLLCVVVAACADVSTLPPTAPGAELPTGVSLAVTPDLRAHTEYSGGTQTVPDSTSEAFGHPFWGLAGVEAALHEEGDEEFEAAFTAGAPSPEAHAGLGPVFDNASCEGCHVADGRGRPPADGISAESFLVRISYPGRDATGGPNPVPGFGGQLQFHAIPGVIPEANLQIQYSQVTGTFADGSTYTLQVPSYSFTSDYEPISKKMLFSPRVAPVNFGLGLLEAIPEATILANEDPNDANNDGISGVANRVWDAAAQQTTIGRFGWKAGAPNLIQQTAGAYNGDMGITSPLFPAESCEGDRTDCARHEPEVNAATVLAVARYMQTLAVPARRGLDDPDANSGELTFYQLGCAACHTPTMKTGTLDGVPSIVPNEFIHPYTDLLLHDMGPDLADGRPDFQATGREWRTPPLWGIGLVKVVNGHTRFLHDGRAQDLQEAVLWHGGEAKKSRDAFTTLTGDARRQLIKFLESL